jgi:hypothetical protein
MSQGIKKTPLDGTELLELINSKNTKNVALGSLEEIADFINSFDIPAEVLMIALLQEMNGHLKCLPELIEQQVKTNEYLKEVLS